jgi:hypothetical protein
VTHLSVALFALVTLASGCIPPQLNASSRFRRPATPLEGKGVVVMFPHHERLQTTAEVLEQTVAGNLAARGVRVYVYRPNQLSLKANPAADYARETQSQFILIYALTSGHLFNMALSEMSSEGALYDAASNAVLWRGSIDYKDMMPGPGSFSKCGQEVGVKLVSTLVQDGFLAR